MAEWRGKNLPSVNQTELESLIYFFQNTLLLEGLDSDMLSRLARSAQKRLCQPCEIICRRNDYAAYFHFIDQGTVAEFSVDRMDFQGTARLYGPGAWFGTLDAMLGDSYTSTAIAAERCSLVVIPAELFRRAMETPGCRHAMLRSLRTQLYAPQDPGLCHLNMNAEERLAYVLLLLQTGSLGMRYVRITQDTFRGKITIRDPHSLAAILINSIREKEASPIKM